MEVPLDRVCRRDEGEEGTSGDVDKEELRKREEGPAEALCEGVNLFPRTVDGRAG